MRRNFPLCESTKQEVELNFNFVSCDLYSLSKFQLKNNRFILIGYLTSMAMNPFSGIPGSHSANFAGGHPSQSGYHHPPLPEQRKNPYALGKQYQELMPALEALQRYGQPPSEQMSMRSLIHQDYHFATQYEPQASAVPTAPNLQKNLRSPNVNLFMAGLSESERHVVANRLVPASNLPPPPKKKLRNGVKRPHIKPPPARSSRNET